MKIYISLPITGRDIEQVEAFHDEEFSYTFGRLADHAALTLDNLIYTEQAKHRIKQR